MSAYIRAEIYAWSINAIACAYLRRFVCAVRSAYYGVRSINPALDLGTGISEQDVGTLKFNI